MDTGFADLSVTEPVTTPVPAVSPAPALVPTPITRRYTVEQALALARAVAECLGPIEPMLADRNISPEFYAALLADPFYAEALARANEEWHSIKSTPQRVALKAAAIIEDSMLVVGARLSNNVEPLEKVAQMTKVYADLAGMGKQQTNNAPQERVTISIDFGADTKLHVEKTIEASPVQEDVEGQSDRPPIQAQPEGQSERPPIQSQPEGPREIPKIQFLPPA